MKFKVLYTNYVAERQWRVVKTKNKRSGQFIGDGTWKLYSCNDNRTDSKNQEWKSSREPGKGVSLEHLFVMDISYCRWIVTDMVYVGMILLSLMIWIVYTIE